MKSLTTNSIFKFFSSLKLAVISLLLLATVLATATILESYYGMRAVHVMVYGTPWFGGVLFLLGLNVLCAALSRYPWKKHQTGFVITHLGIILILVGSVVTQKWGVDGNLPVVEGAADNRVILNALTLRLEDENGGGKTTVLIPESGRKKTGKLITIDLQNQYQLVVDTFLPRTLQSRNFIASPVPGLGQPAIQLHLFNDRFSLDEWLMVNADFKPSELNLGPALVTFEKLWDEGQEKNFVQPTQNKLVQKESKGILVASLQGKDFRLPIQGKVGRWQSLGGQGIEVRVDRYLPYAVVEGKELATRSQEPKNPAVQLTVRRLSDGFEEKYTVFAFFPEFTTLHGKKSAQQSIGLNFRITGFKPPQEELMGVGKARGELKFAQSREGKKLYYRVLAKDGSVNSEGEIQKGKKVATGWMDLNFEILEWFPEAVVDFTPRYVDQIASGDNYLAAIHLKPVGSNVLSKGHWLYEGTAKAFSLGGRDVTAIFEKETLELPFRLYLDKFTIGTNPGTNKAASYQSQVRVQNEGKDILSGPISMNEPLKYGGYTFYQASYQIQEGKPPVSIFSVNYDPGRWIKYLGSILLTLGPIIMFAMNPHYFSVLVGKKPRAK